MDGIHDLGGMEGFGPIPIANGDKDFADIADWEKRMWGLARAGLAKGITIDWFRHGLERMVPGDYLTFPYFKKWCTNYLMLMIDNGAITIDEVARGHVAEPGAPAATLTAADIVALNSRADFSFEIETDAAPRFGTGDTIRTLDMIDHPHTRLPRYARGRTGTVIAHRGSHALPDEGAKGNHVGQHLYTVAFTAPELWGEGADPRDSVTLDLWESYLVPA